MRQELIRFSIVAAVATAATVAVADDFDPSGRHRGASHAPPPHPPARPTAASSDATSPTELRARYTKIVLAQPGVAFPLQRLAQLYRDRDGSLTALVAEFARRAAQPGPEQYAAMVALAGIENLDGHADDACKTYEAAIDLRPGDPTAAIALARVLQDRGDLAGARTRYERALPLQTATNDREQTLRAMMALALDEKDWDAAKRASGQLVKLEPGNLFVRGELARGLFARGEYERAESEWKELVVAASGDNRALSPALADLGRAQAKAHKSAEALATLQRALATAGPEAAVRTSIYETIAEIYRADERLGELVKELEAERTGDFAVLALLGSLYEETGDAARAIATYRRALKRRPENIDLRLRVVRLLQSQGELDSAIAEYEGLVRVAPNNAGIVFEMCEALIQRGARTRALHLLAELEARANGDEEVLSRLGEFYGRIGEAARSLDVLTRLAALGDGRDASHLVDLGDRYYQDGNTPLAVATWKRILTALTPRSRALAALGDVYLEHEMVGDAITLFREAVGLDGSNLGYKKALAGALEHAKSYHEAELDWLELAHKAKEKGDLGLSREARTHLVTLWSLDHVLDAQVPALATAFQSEPPDLDAGRTLAEIQVHQRRLPDAEATLERLITRAPGDTDSYLALERVLVQEGKVELAIATLEKLVSFDPNRARDTYQRMAQYALQIYRDNDAVRYAARAVALNPEDAEGHRRLAEMYRSRQDPEHAIREFRAAIAKNERLYGVYFELADLLLSRNEILEADRLFRRVMRGAPDEELVARAARLSMQINLGSGTLESLERDLLPLAIDNPQKKIYRRLLVELYESLTFTLIQHVRHGAVEDLDAGRAALARVGQRAIKPLLDALADDDEGQQRVAIDVLSYVQNKNAGPALFSFATGPSTTPLRVRAMIACGVLESVALLPRYLRYLFPPRTDGSADSLPSDAVAVAAAWSVARMEEPGALPLLRELMRRGNPEMRAFGVLGLGRLRDVASIGEIARIAKSPDSGNVSRAAAAYTLGELGADSEIPALVAMAEGNEVSPREMALVALSRLQLAHGANRAAVAAMADAVFAGGESDDSRVRSRVSAVHRAGSAALMLLAAGRPGLARLSHSALPVPDGTVNVQAELEHLVPDGFASTERALTLTMFGGELERAALRAMETSSGGAWAVIDALGEGDNTLLPFVGPGDTFEAARVEAGRIARTLDSALVRRATDPDPAMKIRAIALLGHMGSDTATTAIAAATRDSNEDVVRAALTAIGEQWSPRALDGVVGVLRRQGPFSLRVLAVEALGRLGAVGGGQEAARALGEVAVRDEFALVREAALTSLAGFDRTGARRVAAQLIATDPELHVRAAARSILDEAEP